MAPNSKTEEYLPNEVSEEPTKMAKRNYDIVYESVVVYSYIHLAGLYGLHLACTSAKWQTLLFTYIVYCLTTLGITAGAHRLWTHKCYKVKLPLEIFLMLCQSISTQHSIVHWVRDHRLHHKYTDTDADPHNASRGFFFSHIGWLMVRKHPEVMRRGKKLDMCDIYGNPVVMFQERHKSWLIPTMGFLIPTIIPMFIWSETFSNSWHLNLLRFIISLNVTFLVNSVAHMWGNKPYDKSLSSTQSTPFSLLMMGEGFHNYHHVFPFDYRTSELGNYWANYITWFVDLCAFFGLAYDLKTASQDAIKTKAERSGDGSDLWGLVKDL